MRSKLLPGLTGLALVLGCLGAQAMTVVGDPALIRYSGVNELVQSGNYVVDFIEGRSVSTLPSARAAEIAAGDANSVRYAEDNASLTFVVASVIVFGGACAAIFGKVLRRGKRPEPGRAAGWAQALFEMHDADVANLDSMVHGFSRR